MVGGGMVRKAMCVKRGDPAGDESRTGVRGPIGAAKRRNGRRAKGSRKVEAG
jgi:hypothetical protein